MLIPASDRLELFTTKDKRVIINASIRHPPTYQQQENNTNGGDFGSKPSLDRYFDKLTSNDSSNFNDLNQAQSQSQHQRGKVLHFSPHDGGFTVDSQYDDYAPTSGGNYEREMHIHGIVGLLDLSFGRYLFYIDERRLVGHVGDKLIYQVVSGGHVPVYRRDYLTLSQEQLERESIQAILRILSSGCLYFAYNYDLTNSCQRYLEQLNRYHVDSLEETTVGQSTRRPQRVRPLYKFANHRFWWNHYLQRPFLSAEDGGCCELRSPRSCGGEEILCAEFVLPLICGYCGYQSLTDRLLRSDHLAPVVTANKLVKGNSAGSDGGKSAADATGDSDKRYHTISSSAISPNSVGIRAEDLDLLLISRVSAKRAGTRYTRRGLDRHGNAAMFAETELIMRAQDKVSSYVVCRGSLPWRWSQCVNLRYKPPIVIEDTDSLGARQAFRTHFSRMAQDYKGEIVCLNLLNQFGLEKPLGKAYHTALRLLTSNERKDIGYPVKILDFDLNSSGSQRQVLDQLWKTIGESMADQNCTVGELRGSPVIGEMGRFLFASKSSAATMPSKLQQSYGKRRKQSGSGIWLSRKQRGCFRVNCLDCLDRTNMIQFLIGCRAVPMMLESLGDLGRSSKSLTPENGITLDDDCLEFASLEHLLGGDQAMKCFRQLWSENGDQLAQLYTGTAALNRGFILSGVICRRGFAKSFTGSLRDWAFSAGRYYLNNYADSYRQDDFDVFLGNHRGSPDSEEFPLMTAAEYVENQQILQRRQSFINLNPSLSRSRYVTRFAIALTVYLQLALRHWSPKQLKTRWQWIVAFFWLVLMTLWRILIGTRLDWRGLRHPKSGDQCWEGDEVPIVSRLLKQPGGAHD